VASITIDTANSSTSGAVVNVSSMGWSHTVASNPQQVLLLSLAWVSVGGQIFPTSFSRGSQVFVPTGNASTLNLGSGRHLWSQLYYLTAPTVGTATITILFNGSGVYGFGGSVAYWGVDQVTPFDAPSVNFGTGTSATLTRNGAAPDVVVDVVAVDQAPTLTVGANQTQLWNVKSSTQMTGASSREASGGPIMTMTWSWTPARAWNNFALTLRASLIEEENVIDTLGLGVSDNAVATIQVVASDSVAVAIDDVALQSRTPQLGIELHLTESAVVVSTDHVGIKLAITDTASVVILSAAIDIPAVDDGVLGLTEDLTLAFSILTDDLIELLTDEAVLVVGSPFELTETVPLLTTDDATVAVVILASDSVSFAGTEATPTIETDFVQAVQAHADDAMALPAVDEIVVEAAFDTTDECPVVIEMEAVDIFGFIPDYFLEVSASDTCVVRVITYPGIPPTPVGPFADTVVAGLLEATVQDSSTMLSVGVLDDTRLTATDTAAVPIETLLFTLTDSTRLTLTEVGASIQAPFVEFVVTDSGRIAESELLSVGVLGAGSGGAESLTTTVSESRPNVLDLALKNVVDSCAWTLTEPEHIMQNPVGSDLPAPRASEVLTAVITGTVNKPVTETAALFLDEAVLLVRAIAVQDNSALAATDVTAIFAFTELKTASDSLRVAATEGSAFVPIFLLATDTTSVSASDVITPPIVVTVGARDQHAVRFVDHTANDATVFSVVSANESLRFGLTEDVLVNKPILVSDTHAVDLTEVATLVILYADVVHTVSDSHRIVATDTATVFSTVQFLTVTDSLSVTASESASLAVLLVFTVTDSIRITPVENTPQAVIIFFDFEFFHPVDTAVLAFTDAAVRVIDLEYFDKAAVDSAAILASETASIFRVYQEFLVTDSLRIEAVEAATVLRASSVADSAAFTASEILSLARMTVAVDTTVFVISETELAALSAQTLDDAASLSAVEIVTREDVAYAVTDDLAATLTEAAAIVVTLTTSDSAMVAVEDRAGATLEVLADDTAAIACEETTDLQQQWNVTDEVAIQAEGAIVEDLISWTVADDVLVQLDAVLANVADVQVEDTARYFIDSEHLNQITGGVVFITSHVDDTAEVIADELGENSGAGYLTDDACAIACEEVADFEFGRLPEIFIYVPETEDLQAYPYSYAADERNVW
jgi:hypothetical protein